MIPCHRTLTLYFSFTSSIFLRSVRVTDISSLKWVEEWRTISIEIEKDTFIKLCACHYKCISLSLAFRLERSLLTFLSLTITEPRPFYWRENLHTNSEGGGCVSWFTWNYCQWRNIATQIPLRMEIEMAQREEMKKKEITRWLWVWLEWWVFFKSTVSLNLLPLFHHSIHSLLPFSPSHSDWVMNCQSLQSSVHRRRGKRRKNNAKSHHWKRKNEWTNDTSNNMQQMIIWSSERKWLLYTSK